MPEEISALVKKLDRMEVVLSNLESSTSEIADRINLLRQEHGRSAAQLQRLGLTQETFRLAGQRRDEALSQISNELSAIKGELENLKK